MMTSGQGDSLIGRKGASLFPVTVSRLHWLSDHTFEIRFRRPAGFGFVPGQKIGVVYKAVYRDYSLTNSTDDTELGICVRLIPNGMLSPVLSQAKKGDKFSITAAFGFFLYQPHRLPAVFVATGTGIAPFVAFVRAGVQQYHLLHGVRSEAELYYRDLFISSATTYAPCISGSNEDGTKMPESYHCRVTDFLDQQLARGRYDFYLCGRGEMVRDVMHIIDRQFEGSRVFTELFF